MKIDETMKNSSPEQIMQAKKNKSLREQTNSRLQMTNNKKLDGPNRPST